MATVGEQNLRVVGNYGAASAASAEQPSAVSQTSFDSAVLPTRLQRLTSRTALWKGVAFIKRDARIEISYKFQFVWSFAMIFFTIASFYFVAKLVSGAGTSTALSKYGGDYFRFVVVGLAIARYLEASLSGVTIAVRQAMTQGTLEIVFASPTRPMTILSFSAVWQFLIETVRIVFFVWVATVVFGFRLTDPDWLAAVLTLVLTVPAFLSLGVLSASLLILLKRGDPINWFVVSGASLLTGVLFPVDLLPDWLRAVSYFIPMTHSLECFRGCLLLGQSTREIWGSLLPLLAFSVLMLPTAWLASCITLKYAKRSGALGTF